MNAATPDDGSAARSRFSADIKLYIAVSVATGLFGSVRSLCFSLVGSKISNDVRNQLYTSILRQDVAFFDSVTSGELTSRLARDTEGMVSPMQVRRHAREHSLRCRHATRQQLDTLTAQLLLACVSLLSAPPECARHKLVQLPAAVSPPHTLTTLPPRPSDALCRLSTSATLTLFIHRALPCLPVRVLSFGGMIMCFYVSWKLSILAITSIFPIIQITRIYSKSAHAHRAVH